jgi:hypothetical protein
MGGQNTAADVCQPTQSDIMHEQRAESKGNAEWNPAYQSRRLQAVMNTALQLVLRVAPCSRHSSRTCHTTGETTTLAALTRASRLLAGSVDISTPARTCAGLSCWRTCFRHQSADPETSKPYGLLVPGRPVGFSDRTQLQHVVTRTNRDCAAAPRHWNSLPPIVISSFLDCFQYPFKNSLVSC